jgi:DNA-binding NtrC family response regulator
MDTLKFLIVMEEAIFSLGLQVQLKDWGFTEVEIVRNYNDAFRSISYHLPSLTLIDENIISEKTTIQIHELIDKLDNHPIILIGKDPADKNVLHQQLQRDTNYLLLCKPCSEADLKTAIEHLLDIIIPAA